MTEVKLRLSFNSRFKRTNLYTRRGRTFFGLFRPPQIRLDGDEKIVTVDQSIEGQLDTLAYREYDTRELFWAIALVNNIRNIPEEVLCGTTLIIPKQENIRIALLAGEQIATSI